jgi:hypothetical protein
MREVGGQSQIGADQGVGPERGPRAVAGDCGGSTAPRLEGRPAARGRARTCTERPVAETGVDARAAAQGPGQSEGGTGAGAGQIRATAGIAQRVDACQRR